MLRPKSRETRISSVLDFPDEMPTHRELAPKSRRGNDSINSKSTECDDPDSDECR